MENMIATRIRDSLTVEQVLSMYGYPTSRHKRIPCPIHKGHDANFCYTDRLYHCWSCDAGGDVITLVMELYGLDFMHACQKLNSDFQLGLMRKPSAQEKRLWAEQRKIDDAEKRFIERKKAYYDGCAAYYRELFKRICNGCKDHEIIETADSLENWLDDNIDEVVQRWTS